LTRINGLEIYYRRRDGVARSFLLHGWGVSSQTLAGVAARLAAEFESCRSICPDSGGVRLRPKAGGPSSMPIWSCDSWTSGVSQRRAAGALLRRRIAVRLAAQWPARVSRLVLVAGAGVRLRRSLTVRAKVAATRLVDGSWPFRAGDRWASDFSAMARPDGVAGLPGSRRHASDAGPGRE